MYPKTTDCGFVKDRPIFTMSTSQKLPSFGLILPKSKAKRETSSSGNPTSFTSKVKNRKSVFGDESSDDDGDSASELKAAQAKIKRDIALTQARQAEKAAKEYERVSKADPLVYEYDGLYDEIKDRERQKQEVLKGSDKKVCYSSKFEAS